MIGKRRGTAGFTLLELIISLSLSTLVLIGVIVLATQLVRNEYSTVKSAEVSAQTLAALDAMSRELENATYVDPNNPSASGGSVIAACLNYSAAMASQGMSGPFPPRASGSVDGTADLKGFVYCVQPGGSAPGNLDSLLRYPRFGQYLTCPPPVPACGSGAFETLVNKNLSRHPAYNRYFNRDTSIGGVDLHFVVGYATPTLSGQGGSVAGQVALAQPVAYYIDTKIAMAKNYLDTSD